ncbi:MAG: hypothetical protein Q9196_005362 [Gyalolechia fulgens]
MFNDTTRQAFPALPLPELGPRASLLPFLADQHLPYIVPAVFFWVISLVFHYIDHRGLLGQYRLHTSAEDLTKNRASRKDVIKFALIQQAAQCLLGYLMADDTEQLVSPRYAIAVWAQRLQSVELRSLQWIRFLASYGSKLSRVGIPVTLSHDPLGVLFKDTARTLRWPTDDTMAFTSRHLILATAIYWVLFPLFQYTSAMVLADTMQYFAHRAFHANRWLYSKLAPLRPLWSTNGLIEHIHSMHHDIYVPFAYGAFYNHPLETIPIDAIGFPICLAIVGLDNRQAAFFGAIWTFKTVVDHCGYDFPYNPCNIVCPNSVLFHDLHHQSWGMKHNFSVYGAFWDWFMGTRWSPHDSKAQAKYRKGRAMAEVVTAKARSQAQVPEPVLGKSTAVKL